MSIPPLVCSTPPPPEQCDDDRDVEDFDIQYNLSQDEEDDGQNFNFGTYSDYVYPTSTSSNIHQDIWSSNISKKTDDKKCSSLSEERKETIILPKSDSSSVNKVAIEDIVLEDLNLSLEDQNDEPTLEQNVNQFDSESFGLDCSIDSSKKPTDILVKSEDGIPYTVSQDCNEDILVNDVKTLEKNEDCLIEEIVIEKYTQEDFVVDTKEIDTSEKEMGDITIDTISFNLTEPPESNIPVKEEDIVITSEFKKEEELLDDDFGEFDDFQFISTENNPPTSITYCDNPWKNEVFKNSEFGDFTATFDVDEGNSCRNIDRIDENKASEDDNVQPVVDDSDDFGDFDDFKSSSNDYKETISFEKDPSQNVPNLSLYSPDSEIQIIESINSVLSSIFTSEILEHEDGFSGKLESLLNETWGHLVDTDIRQSYIVNWNNSLGQKSLLKALCIDSRNILFGPKWNNSMPKYAANLTVAPLQPQKPLTPTNTRSADEQNVDKTTNKETGTWSDPFTSDGKEYTYAEALLLDLEHLMATLDQMAHKHSSFKISDLLTNACTSESESTAAITRPANLDLFKNAMPPEMGHIYSSTLPVQPIRQINLPDTHIFTPTDSETPRSKTIHYVQAPALLVPQPSESSQQIDELSSKSKSEVPNSENEEEYWEFQDFKSGNGDSSKNVTSSINQIINTTPTNNSSVVQIIKTYESQILQPIKVEPIKPSLNWPNPGEVKETFNEFSEYISNTSWSNENTNTVSQSDQKNSEPESGTDILEDDFETFQSAPTFKSAIKPTDRIYPTTTSINQNLKDVPQHFIDSSDTSHTTNYKTGGNILKQSMVQNESSLPCVDSSTIVKDTNEKTSPVLSSGSQSISATIMQPSIANTSTSQRHHQQTGQILQPLSLESYSQINWPSPGIDLQDLSRFNPVESLQSLKTELSTGGSSKLSSPAHKDANSARNEICDDDIWGDFVSSKPKQQQNQPKKIAMFADDDEWTDFVSSPSVKPQNGLNTISLNVHTNLNMQKTLGPNKFHNKNNQLSLDIPTLKYVTPKSSSRGLYNDKHFQNL